MSKRTLSATVDEETYEDIDDLSDENTSKTVREVLNYGLDRYKRREQTPWPTEPARKGMEITAVATVLTLAVAIGLSSAQVWQLAGGFAGVTTTFGGVWASCRYIARS